MGLMELILERLLRNQFRLSAGLEFGGGAIALLLSRLGNGLNAVFLQGLLPAILLGQRVYGLYAWSTQNLPGAAEIFVAPEQK